MELERKFKRTCRRRETMPGPGGVENLEYRLAEGQGQGLNLRKQVASSDRGRAGPRTVRTSRPVL
eukprot:395874-Amorphochlora_amoeboformis.AAC.1